MNHSGNTSVIVIGRKTAIKMCTYQIYVILNVYKHYLGWGKTVLPHSEIHNFTILLNIT